MSKILGKYGSWSHRKFCQLMYQNCILEQSLHDYNIMYKPVLVLEKYRNKSREESNQLINACVVFNDKILCEITHDEFLNYEDYSNKPVYADYIDLFGYIMKSHVFMFKKPVFQPKNTYKTNLNELEDLNMSFKILMAQQHVDYHDFKKHAQQLFSNYDIMNYIIIDEHINAVKFMCDDDQTPEELIFIILRNTFKYKSPDEILIYKDRVINQIILGLLKILC